MNYRHVVFDLDGTLIDSAVQCADVLSEMLASRDSERRVARADAMAHMSFGGLHLVTTLLGADCGDADLELADFRSRYAARPTLETCLYPGVRAGIVELAAAGLGIGICSNKPQELCDKIVDELRLRELVGAVVGGRADLPAKPHRAMLDLVLAELDATNDSALLIGDSEVDEAVARAVGLPFWFVDYGYPGLAWVPVADATFASFPAVIAALVQPDLQRASA